MGKCSAGVVSHVNITIANTASHNITLLDLQSTSLVYLCLKWREVPIVKNNAEKYVFSHILKEASHEQDDVLPVDLYESQIDKILKGEVGNGPKEDSSVFSHE